MIKARYRLPIASPGTILREEKAKGSQLGLEADQLTSQGRLVPDALVNGLVEGWLQRHPRGFVFDGYPRSGGQADALDGMLSKLGSELDLVLHLEVDLPVIRNRVANRVVCAACGWVGSVGLGVAKPEEGCPVCGGELTRRRDDSPETLAARMTEYAEKTEPLIARYRERGILCSVNAGGRPETVFDSISRIVEAA